MAAEDLRLRRLRDCDVCRRPRWNLWRIASLFCRWMAAAKTIGFTDLAWLASKALGTKKGSFAAFRQLGP